MRTKGTPNRPTIGHKGTGFLHSLTGRIACTCARRVALPTMRLVIARCSVDYAGRLTAHLPSAPRLILVKADGSVSIHADDRAYKPLNWMSPPCTLKEGTG